MCLCSGMAANCVEVHRKVPPTHVKYSTTTTTPWLRIHMDFAGPYYGKMFLIVVDAYSKWLEVAMMKEATSLATVNKLRQIHHQLC